MQSLNFGTNSCPPFSAKSYIVRRHRRRAAASATRDGVWQRPLLMLTRFSVVHILHSEELLLQERPRRHQDEGGRQRRLLCRRGIALVAACGSGAAYSGVVLRRQLPAPALSWTASAAATPASSIWTSTLCPKFLKICPTNLRQFCHSDQQKCQLNGHSKYLQPDYDISCSGYNLTVRRAG